MYKKIQEEIDKIRRKYLDSAEEIVSGYNRECSLSKDYEGRQLFELLQNADDESVGSAGKVLIKFDGKTLTVSNTGEPFSFQGVKSLLYPNASPKKIHADKIGCKGLGFRSILTWANCVTVASAEFTIQFSREYATEFLDSIIEEKPELSSEIKALSLDESPIATLTCPHILEKNALVSGYSTSIIVECREELTDTIADQIKGLQFEELVFLNNLKEIEIECNNYHKTFSKQVEGNNVVIKTFDKNTGESDCVSWILYKQVGSIADENGKDKNYEFIIAYDLSGEHFGEVLYSYFKTDIKLGFPALIHGTFDLTSDRNGLQKASYVNQQLVELLADFMVKTAVCISESQSECNYNPLKLIISSDIDYVLSSEFKFDVLLKELAKEEKILPTIANKYISIADAPMYSDKHFAEVLNPETFSNVLKNTEEKNVDRYLKKELELSFYDYEEFCRKLNDGISYYSIDEKATLAVLINKQFCHPTSKGIFPHILVDINGNNITDSSKVYPLPSEEQVIALPSWVDIKFLDMEMEELLFEKLQINNSRRDLAQAMSKYNLEEYSFDRLLRGVVKQVDEKIISKKRCSDILNWLWGYYNSKERQQISDVRVKVVCRDGEIRYAKECYIGREYGNELGERLIGLYSSNFVSLKELGIQCEDTSSIAGFLEWLGASRYPRLIDKTLIGDERSDFLKTCYPLYVQLDNCWYDSNDFTYIKVVKVKSIEKFETILAQANFNDILAWFLLDEDIKIRIECETEEKNTTSCIEGLPLRKKYLRTVSCNYIKSYIRFYLTRTKWISDEKGNKEIPIQCCFENNELAPFIIVPSVDYSYLKNAVGRDCRKDVGALLCRIGVADTFQEMNKVVIYNALLLLPELDKECKRGRSLYRKIIRDGDSPEEYKKNNSAYENFVANGYILAKKDGVRKYVPVREARYADKKMFSNEILKAFNMADIEPRSGEEKIKKLFGVISLKYDNVEIDGEPEIHLLDEEFKKEYLRFIPFVYACRMGLKNSGSDFSHLNKTRIVLCSQVYIKYTVDKESKTISLGEYETVYLSKKNIAYICAPKKYTSFDELKRVFDFADKVAELVTAILDVNEGKDFYRDLFRENTSVREKKMRMDKGDENLELLSEARRKFHSEINPRDEFWMTVADIMKIPDSADDSADDSANKLIKQLGFSHDIDSEVDFDDLTNPKNAEFIIDVFQKLGFDSKEYNSIAVHNVDVSRHWKMQLNDRMKLYKTRYQAYLYEKYKDNEQCVQLYDQLLEKYVFLDPSILNSVYFDIDATFEAEIGITFDELNQYSETEIAELYQKKKSKIDTETWDRITKSYSSTIVKAYLIFDRIDELAHNEERESTGEPVPDRTSMLDLVGDILNTPITGLVTIGTGVKEYEQNSSSNAKDSKHQKKVHSEISERKKQEYGMMGEAFVFKEILALYPDAMWVSGNAEKANQVMKGDDSCGYDIRYTDEKGTIQYVEVKASRSSDIIFYLSDNELRFACENADCYEIIYVVLDDNGKPAHKPWRLGHLFAFDEGENLFHNTHFTITSKEYIINAEPINSNPGIDFWGTFC